MAAFWNKVKKVQDSCRPFCSVIVPAAGTSSRMGGENKMFLPLHGVPVLVRTLQAIDKLGDRIIGYMANADTQRLRDENQALRLSASQAAQNAYLIGQLRPSPIPSYRVANPYCCNNNPCDCNGGW